MIYYRGNSRPSKVDGEALGKKKGFVYGIHLFDSDL